ncbi:disintegrin and metalloproteinase domain-containing protein 10-like [Centruroides vittatus]|uniref:disintegrin and metalloproteinase domain-containing protein 10-like n=1 Tax=Centruroides vittatus TaxID=120091 RepID=UPI00350F9507
MVFIHKNNKIIKMYPRNILGSSIFEGIIEGKSGSLVNGYFDGGIFTGRVDTGEEVYYLEPASVHLKDEIYADKVMIYKEKDVLPVGCKFQDGKHVCQEHSRTADDTVSIEEMHFHPFNVSEILQTESKEIERNLKCELELFADHTFSSYKKNDHSSIIAAMIYHVKLADKIFRFTDMDNDLVADGIGFLVNKISIFEDENQPGYPLKEESTNSDTVFRSLTSYNQRQCLLVAFAHRDFDGGVIGKAFVPSPRGVGGICSRLRGQSVNNNLITIRNSGEVLPAVKVTLATTHEIGHSFGSKHDPVNDPNCSPGISIGNYIMYPSVSHGDKGNNWVFSSCSRKMMKDVIIANGRCLKKQTSAVCGNSITEDGEECDCGQQCNTLDKCCVPPGSYDECTIKKSEGVQCSPREGQCCTDDCKIVSASAKTLCFINLPCRKRISVCDGLSSFCPETLVPDGTPCMESIRTCFSGICRSDVCNDNNLQSCECSVLSGKECHVCCLDTSNKCHSVQDLNIRVSNGRYFKLHGTPCNYNRGKCRSNGTCSRDAPEETRVPPRWTQGPTRFQTIRPRFTPRRPTFRRWYTLPRATGLFPTQPPRFPPREPPPPRIPPKYPPFPPRKPPPPRIPPQYPPFPPRSPPDSGPRKFERGLNYFTIYKFWPLFLPLPILFVFIVVIYICSCRQ